MPYDELAPKFIRPESTQLMDQLHSVILNAMDHLVPVYINLATPKRILHRNLGCPLAWGVWGAPWLLLICVLPCNSSSLCVWWSLYHICPCWTGYFLFVRSHPALQHNMRSSYGLTFIIFSVRHYTQKFICFLKLTSWEQLLPQQLSQITCELFHHQVTAKRGWQTTPGQ